MAKTNSYATDTATRTKLATGLDAPGVGVGSVKNYTQGGIADLYRGTKGADIASATTPDLGAATGNTVHITGTTTITGWGTADAGIERETIFDGVLQLTHNATSMILLTGANITTAAGDTARWVSEGSGNWRMLRFARKSGQPLAGGGVSSVNGKTGAVSELQSITVACSDETTNLTTGTAKITFRMPYAFTVTAVRASLTTAQTAGSIFTVDINESGTSILSTKLTIDNSEKTSTTAATPAVISDTSLADDAEITIDIDQVGTPLAKGLKVALIGYPT
jgi:hypothetical protein